MPAAGRGCELKARTCATEQLLGCSGTMQIMVADGNHSSDFDYVLPD